jgi:uncharacterized membrane protein YbhN (UPF0104 family)
MAVVGAPGNVGAFELAAAGALGLFAVPKEVALSAALAYHVIDLVPIVLIGLALLWTGRLVVRRPPRFTEPAD